MNQPPARSPVNLGAVIGVVFVFLVGVVIWVIFDAARNEDAATPPSTTRDLGPLIVDASTTAPTPTTTSATTSPVLLPATIVSATTPATTAPSTTVASTTVAPSTTMAPSTTVAPTTSTTKPEAPSGDLGITGHAISRPGCDNTYITVIASAVGDDATPNAVGSVIENYSGSHYLRTDQTCPSLTQSIDGAAIYVVYFGPYTDETEACNARSSGTSDAYVRQLSRDVGPEHRVECSG